MEYTYLEIDPPLCYLVYQNFLVTNVPKTKLDDCVNKLDNRESIRYNNSIKVFRLNHLFKLTFEHEKRIFSLNDGITEHTEILLDANLRAVLADWLGKQLLLRDYRPIKQRVPDRVYIKRGLAWMLVVVVAVAALDNMAWAGIKSGSRHILCRLINQVGSEGIYIAAAGVLVAMILWTAYKIRHGGLQTVYKYK